MADLVVIVPSRGRPQAARELAEACAETCRADTLLTFSVDLEDPSGCQEYGLATKGILARSTAKSSVVSWGSVEPRSMVRALNRPARAYAGCEDTLPHGWDEPAFALGFMGDDHRPKSVGWDKAYLDALREMGTGIVYGDDLLQGENLPTQCAMTSDIVRALGWMAPPTLRHLAVDNWWKELGNGADCLRYLPDVIVEHMHPVAGKARWDEGYVRVNSTAMYEHDLTELARLRRVELPGAIDKVRACMAVSAALR